MLWRALGNAKLYRPDVYATNVVQSPPELKSGKPSAAQIRAEWGRLDAILGASQAEVILCVGGIALQRVTGIKKGITAMRGYVLQPRDARDVPRRQRVQVGEYKTTRKGKYTKGDPKFADRVIPTPAVLPPNCKYIIPVLHPAGILRSRWTTWPALVADTLRLGRALRGELDLIDAVPYMDVCDNSNLMWMTHDGPVAWDIETDGNTITCLGISNGKTTYSLAIDRRVVTYIRNTLLDPAAIIICHNLAFDIPRLCDLVGISIDDIKATLEDTMLEAQLICPDLPKGLEKVAPLYLDVTPWKDTSEDDNPAYNAKDVYTTMRIRNRMEELLDGQRAEYNAILRAVPSLWKATRRGLRVDLQRVSVWRPQLEEAVVDSLRRWHTEVGKAGKGETPSPGSNPQLARFLYFGLRLPPQYGKEGQLAVDEAALEELKYNKPEYTDMLQALLDFRSASRDLSKWGGLTEPRIYPSFLPSAKEEKGKGQGAATGRIQAREPNIMNLDRENRDIIIADPGMFLGYVDWSQAEARVEAHAFGDDDLMRALGEDLHSYIGEKRGIDRVRAKNFWYGTGRGAGPRKLKKVMWANGFRDVTEADCRMFQAQLAGLFPKWARGRQEMTALAQSRLWIDTPFGRRRRWSVKPGLPDVIGFYPQATVAGMLLRVLPEVDKHVELLAPMHDAVLFQTDKEEAVQAVLDIFNREWPEIGPGFVVPATAAIGDNWKELE